MDLNTTHKHDYTPHPVSSFVPPRERKKYQGLTPFAGVSTYKSNFLNWGQTPLNSLRPPYNQTVVKDLPFVGRTIYKDTISTHKDPVENPPFKKG